MVQIIDTDIFFRLAQYNVGSVMFSEESFSIQPIYI
jgi:hypothetical protein